MSAFSRSVLATTSIRRCSTGSGRRIRAFRITFSPKEDLEIKVSNFFQRVSSPVLADLDLDFGPVLTEYTYPRKLTDLFRGMQMTIIGRYKNTNDLKNITLKLTGKAGRESRSFNYTDLDFPVSSDQNDFLPRLWASRRVGWLLGADPLQRRDKGDPRRGRRTRHAVRPCDAIHIVFGDRRLDGKCSAGRPDGGGHHA